MDTKQLIKQKVAAFLIMLLTFGVLSSNDLRIAATDAAKGVQVNVDHSALDAAVKKAKDAGVDVTKTADVDKGTANALAELDPIKAEIEKDYLAQIKTLEDAKVELDDYNKKKAEYDKQKAQYDKDLVEYNKKKAAYDAAVIQYNKDMAELERLKNTDGYLSKPAPQSLVFLSEPNAKMDIQGKVYDSAEWIAALRNMGYHSGEVYNTVNKYDIDYAPKYKASRVYLEKDKPLKVVYTNLQNSTFNDKKIAKVEYTYTLKVLANGKDKIPAILYPDPTVTINYSDLDSTAEVQMDVVFYDDAGQKIDMEGGLLSFSSLNRDLDNGVNREEYVIGFNGELIPITGSSIAISGDKASSNLPSNEFKAHGSKYDHTEWDGDSDAYPKQWYGAIVGKIGKNGISFRFGSVNRRGIWFALNSKIRALKVPRKPVAPVAPIEPQAPQKPDTKVTYHYDIAFVKSQAEKKVTDEAGTDINDKSVLVGSVVKFTLNTTDLPANREKMEKVVFDDDLPAGYELDLNATKTASGDYDVTYDQNTRLLTFTAKASLLERLNKDVSKTVSIPSPVIVGKVTAEGTTYENDFDITINNVYKVRSKPVKVHTPTKPKKGVFETGQTETFIDGKVVVAGQELLYKVTYKNTTGEMREVTISDKIPDHTSYVAGSASDNGQESGGTITWKKKVNKDETWTVSFKVTVDKAVNGEVLKNKAKVNDGKNDFTTNETTNPTPTQPTKDVVSPGKLDTSIDGKVVSAGEQLVYKVTYKNTTGEDRQVTITDKVPEHTTYVANTATDNGQEANGTITWTKEVKKDASWTVMFTVKVDDNVNGEVIENTAKVNDGKNDFKTNDTHNPTGTKPKKDVVSPGKLDTSIDGKVVSAGEELVYKITYINTTGAAIDVTITDQIPAHTTFLKADNGGVEKNGVVTWTQHVAAGDSLTVMFHVKVDEDVNGDLIPNTAQVHDGKNNYTTNTVKNPTSTEIKLTAKKILTGRALKDGEFEFVLTAQDGKEVEVVKNAVNGMIEFKALKFTAPGTYTYKITEKVGDLGGITYDKSAVTARVTVAADADGKLKATVAYENGDQTFENSYGSKVAKIKLSASKVLSGRTLKDGEFEFVLTDQDGKEVETVKNVADGSVNFTELSFDKVGTYTYTISEKAGALGGITYDTTVVKATVTVTDNGAGQLVANVTYENNDQEFNNVYKPAPTTVDLKANKVLSGRDLKEGEFEFVLTDQDGQTVQTVKNAADGSITFSGLTFDKVGVYTYTISEKAGTVPGVTYDATVVKATVTVTDNGVGQLVAEVAYDNNDQTFENSYEVAPTSANLSVTKVLTGRDLKEGEFEFVLTAQDGKEVETAKNAADGSVKFTPLTYTKAGTYTYTIAEKAGNLGGITYDTNVITATVTVTDNGKGQFIVDVAYANNQRQFTNIYKPAPTSAILSAKKVLTGRDLKEGEFEFALIDQASQEVQVVKNAADGSITFDELTFDQVGTYTYIIKEKQGGVPGVTYDASTITATITVTDNGHGQLVASVAYANDDQQFDNSYLAQPAIANTAAKKILTGRDLKAGEFEFVLTDQDGKVLETVANGADGSIIFTPLTFKKVGTYTYTISETAGTLGGITYDSNTIKVTITVTDDGNGQLVAKVAYSMENPSFNNSYAVSPATAKLSAKKILEGRDLKEGEFEFVLTDQDGKELETVKNAADGSISFTELSFKQAGLYTYTISEKVGSLADVKYDRSVITVVIKVEDDGKGKLQASVTYAGDDQTFKNTFKPEEPPKPTPPPTEEPPRPTPPPKTEEPPLPKTGEKVAGGLTALGFILLGIAGFVIYKKRK